MADKYIPFYAKGQILVSFGEEISDDFIRDFGKKIGYEFLESEPMPYFYLFKTEVGKENKAIKDFLKYKEFVKFAERRDLRIEKRFEFTEDLESKVKNLDQTLSKKEFLEELNRVKNYIEGFDDSIID